jgi:hypothetical protein
MTEVTIEHIAIGACALLLVIAYVAVARIMIGEVRKNEQDKTRS